MLLEPENSVVIYISPDNVLLADVMYTQENMYICEYKTVRYGNHEYTKPSAHSCFYSYG